jgi:hypothetical protein
VTIEWRKRHPKHDVTWMDQFIAKCEAIGASCTIAVISVGFTNMPTHPPDISRPGPTVPLGSNSLQDGVQAISQFNRGLERHPDTPFGAQCLNHFRKPYSLRVTCRHL